MIAFLDTNVLVYYVDSRDPKKQRQAETIVDSALDGRMMCLLSVQTLTEFVNVLLGKLKIPQEVIEQYLEVFSEMPVISPDVKTVRRGLDIKGRYGIQFYDAMMISAAERAGAEVIYSEDLNDGQMYGSVRAVNPFK